MIKIPDYIECFAKVVSFLGLDYSENKTGKFRMKEREDFVNQGKIYTEQYEPKILDLFAGENEEKRVFIDLFLIMSESLVRYLTCKNYYTLASQKRAMWGLMIFYYIPHIACFISIYKKEFDIPKCLVEKDFMLPFVDENGKVVSPTLSLTRYLTPIERGIDGKYQDASDNLNSYIKNLSKKPVPSYKKHQEIIEQLSAIPALKDKIPEISLVFRATIVSAHVYQELLKLFGDEIHVLSLIDYFKKCLKTSEPFFEGIDENDNFSYYFYRYLDYYECELQYTITTHKNIRVHFYFKTSEGDNVLYGHNELWEQREDLREDIFEPFNFLLETTTSNTRDDLFEIDTDDLIKSSRFLKADENKISDLFKIRKLKLLSDDADEIFSSPEYVLQENEVNLLLQAFKTHSFYAIYEHEYLYYASLNDLAKNDFENALKKLKQAFEICMTITAGETQLKIAKKLIVLTLLTNSNFSFSHLNPSIRLMIDAEPEDGLFLIPPLNSQQEISEEEKHRQIYFAKILKIVTTFNSSGYCHYEGFGCVKYNPFEKVERLIADFYEFYNDDSQIFESEQNKVESILKSLMRGRGAKYPIDKNLVTLHQLKAVDVFKSFNFTNICSFYSDSKIDNKNIFKLYHDQETLNLIFKAVST